ncbi:DUF5993 family protein [Urechidicola sp. KH5]
MSLIFLLYVLAFFMLFKKDKGKAYFFFVLATSASICMFVYHANSSLNLSF